MGDDGGGHLELSIMNRVEVGECCGWLIAGVPPAASVAADSSYTDPWTAAGGKWRRSLARWPSCPMWTS